MGTNDDVERLVADARANLENERASLFYDQGEWVKARDAFDIVV